MEPKSLTICRFLFANKENLRNANVSVLFKDFSKSNPKLNGQITEGYFKGILKKFVEDKDWQKQQVNKIHNVTKTVDASFVIEDEKPKEPIKLKVHRIALTDEDEGLFDTYRSGKKIDMMLSDEEGVMKGTTIMITGGSGSGKSTVCYDLYSSIKRHNKGVRMGFLNSEMSEIDLKYVLKTKPYLKDIDFVLLKDYGYQNTPEVVKAFLSEGFDIIFIDSFQDIVDKLKDICGFVGSEAETFLLNALDDSANGVNKTGVKTANIIINQVTKGGVFKGSNRIKHSITAMMHLEIDSNRDRFAYTSKNRRGDDNVMKMMKYIKGSNGELEYVLVDDIVVGDNDNDDDDN